MDVEVLIPPGVVATPTKAYKSSSWRETNLIRWDNGIMQPVGGWELLSTTLADTSEKIRAIYAWFDLSNIKWVAYLTETKLYIDTGASTLFDASPTVPLVPPDYSGGGGYGDGPYGDSTYGTPRAAGPVRNAIGPAFKLENWGENLLIMSSADGRLLEWVPNVTPAVCAPVANAPSGRSFLVTPERHVFIIQAAGNPSTFAWCDQGDNTEWTIGVTTKAGEYQVEPGGPILSAINTPNGNLFWTDKHLTMSQYIGLPAIYTREPLGQMSSPVSSSAIIKTADGAFWMTEAGPFIFNGSSVTPLPCPVWDWIKANIDWQTARLWSFCVDSPNNSEVSFHFPSLPGGDNDRYVTFNYKDGWWSTGKMKRSAGFAANYIDFPLMAGNYRIFRHETADQYPGAEELPWAESFTLNAQEGSKLATLRRIMPEVEGDISALRFSLAYTLDRSPNDETYSSQREIQPTGWAEFMVSARDFRLRVDSTSPEQGDWTLGPILVDIVARGKRAK